MYFKTWVRSEHNGITKPERWILPSNINFTQKFCSSGHKGCLDLFSKKTLYWLVFSPLYRSTDFKSTIFLSCSPEWVYKRFTIMTKKHFPQNRKLKESKWCREVTIHLPVALTPWGNTDINQNRENFNRFSHLG